MSFVAVTMRDVKVYFAGLCAVVVTFVGLYSQYFTEEEAGGTDVIARDQGRC